MSRLTDLQRTIAALHVSDDPIDDRALDARIGLRAAEPESSLGDLLMRYGHHRMERGDMAYDVIRQLFRGLRRLPLRSRLIDLGCGYGRIGFYGALLTQEPFWGVELVAERVAEARRLKADLGLDDLEFECADALATEWPEGDRFCIMNSFLMSRFAALIERLEARSRRRQILVASISTSNFVFQELPWLEEVRPKDTTGAAPSSLRFFLSRPP